MMTTFKQKYAIYFPDFQSEDEDIKAVSLFSEKALLRTEKMLVESHDSMGGLLGLAVELNRTHELGKQIEHLKHGLDVSIDEAKAQLEIKLEEEAERLKIQLEADKEKLRIDIENLNLKIQEQSSKFKKSFEKSLRSEKLFQELIKQELSTIKKYQMFINNLPESFQCYREYLVCCDVQKKALDQINKYLAEII